MMRKQALWFTTSAAGQLLVQSSIAFAEAAHGSGHEHGHHGGGGIEALVWPLVNFLIFAAIVVTIYHRNVKALVAARARDIAQHIKSAGQKLEVARHELADVNDRLESIQVEKEAIRNRFDSDGQRMAEDIVRSAERAAQTVRQDMVRRVESEFRQATKEIRAEMVAVAARRARERLQNEFTPQQDSGLRRSAVDALEIK